MESRRENPIGEVELKLKGLEESVPIRLESYPTEFLRVREVISGLKTKGIEIPEEVTNRVKKLEANYRRAFDNYTEYLMITSAGAAGGAA